MSPAEKREALLVLAKRKETHGLLAAALTQIAYLDLSDTATCGRWAAICEAEVCDTRSDLAYRRIALRTAASILRAVAS